MLPSKRLAIILGVGLASAGLVLLIHYIDSDKWEWTEAVSSMVTLVATAFVIVGLLEWEEQRRWKPAEGENLRSVVLLSHLIASGWGSPNDIDSEDFAPSKAREALKDQWERLREASRSLDGLRQRLETESELVAIVDIPYDVKTLRLYDLEGSRRRRLDYLIALVSTYLPTLVERRNEPELFTKFVVLRHAVLAANAACKLTDATIQERIFMAPPQILKPHLDKHPELIAGDPVAALWRVMEYVAGAYDQKRVLAILTKKSTGHNSLGELTFLPDCLGQLRNEMRWVEKSLALLEAVIAYLEPDLRPSPADVEAELLALGMNGASSNEQAHPHHRRP